MWPSLLWMMTVSMKLYSLVPQEDVGVV